MVRIIDQPAGKTQMPPVQGTELQQSELKTHCCPYKPQALVPPEPPDEVPPDEVPPLPPLPVVPPLPPVDVPPVPVPPLLVPPLPPLFVPPLPPVLVPPLPPVLVPPLPPLPVPPVPPPPVVVPHVPMTEPGGWMHNVPRQQSPLMVHAPPACEQLEVPVMQRN